MNHEAFSAEFGALTEDEQGRVVGGDGQSAQTVGWFVGYALSCMAQAILVDYKLSQHMQVTYVEGYGWI